MTHTNDLPIDRKPTTQKVPTGVLATEPAGAIGGSISAVLVALFAVLRAFDVGVTDDMSDAMVALVVALCAIPAVSGFLTRFFVVSPSTAADAVNAAVKAESAERVDPMQPDTW